VQGRRAQLLTRVGQEGADGWKVAAATKNKDKDAGQACSATLDWWSQR
jgi:hypothetical protein